MKSLTKVSNKPIVYNIDNGIEIQIETQYRPDLSGGERKNLFEYNIRIKNLNSYPVKLLSREWDIFDANLTRKNVKGPGVVGKKPELNEKQFHQYTSYVKLESQMGNMKGIYIFKSLEEGNQFNVEIPQFDFFHPSLNN